jgi:hypothetical protein
MFKKEKINPLENAINEVEDKIKKSSDPYYLRILENLKHIQRDLNSSNIKGDSNKYQYP